MDSRRFHDEEEHEEGKPFIQEKSTVRVSVRKS